MKYIYDEKGNGYACDRNRPGVTAESPILYKTVARATNESAIVVVDRNWIKKTPELSKEEWRLISSDDNFNCYGKLPSREEEITEIWEDPELFDKLLRETEQ